MVKYKIANKWYDWVIFFMLIVSIYFLSIVTIIGAGELAAQFPPEYAYLSCFIIITMGCVIGGIVTFCTKLFPKLKLKAVKNVKKR